MAMINHGISILVLPINLGDFQAQSNFKKNNILTIPKYTM